MGCGASTQSPGGGDAPVKDNGLAKGIVPSMSGKGKYDMPALFAQFDADGDGKLDIYEIARAFRAIGLTKRAGEKSDMDKAMFKSFDTNGDGYITMAELDANMPKALRDKIDAKIDLGWKFDKASWDASVKRHKKHDMKKIFGQFDADGDGKLDIYEIARAFRAMGLPKRDGTKMDMDHKMFKSFDTNGDGYISMEVCAPLAHACTRDFLSLTHTARLHCCAPNRCFLRDTCSPPFFFTWPARVPQELDANLKPKTRRKIETAIENGWKFDKPTWEASIARHKK